VTSARRVTRQPRTLFPGQRRFALRLAGILESARLRRAPEPEDGTPVAIEDGESTAAVPYETMNELVFGRAA